MADSALLEQRGAQFIHGPECVRIVGQSPGDSTPAGGDRPDARGEQLFGVDRQKGRGPFVRPLILEIAGHAGDFDQLAGGRRADALLLFDDLLIQAGIRVVVADRIEPAGRTEVHRAPTIPFRVWGFYHRIRKFDCGSMATRPERE